RAGWSVAVRRQAENLAATIPLFAVLFIPIVAGMHDLYPWTHADHVAEDAILQSKTGYLNTTFFLIRAAIYLISWSALALWIRKRSLSQDQDGAPQTTRTLQNVSAPAILWFAVSVTFASFDWIMSLDPHWFSAVFGLEVAAGQVVAALAFAIVWRLGPAPAPAVPPERRHDLGGLLLAVALLWAYLAFMQLVTVWIANLPAEIRWYLPRLDTAWRFLGGAVIALHLALPVPLLLVRAAKRSAVGLGLAAALMLAGQAAHALWLVLPGHTGAGGFFAAAALLAAFGGLWLAALGRPPATERTGFTASGTPSHG
ncbi:MAG TPA: hypothetical protein VLW45_11695, partial [Pelomicrobium sp.]|nr:hypothetical protein [Pelomicrobium sp.]